MSSTDQTSDSDELERAAGQIEAPLASLVGDYEESQSDSPTEAKGIFLLPNLFTSGALFCGFYSIIAGMQGDFYAGAVAILVAMVFDGLDGRVARLTGTNSAFGAQYDSLADMVSFGVAPALLTFNWALTDLGKELGLSRERVRQIEQRVKLKLRRSLADLADDTMAPIAA